MNPQETPPNGTTVVIQTLKWPETLHWRLPGVLLGSDAHGDWIGYPRGTRYVRPGFEVTSSHDAVTLVPHAEDGRRPGWLATCHAPGGLRLLNRDGEAAEVYIDVTTPAVWHGDEVRAVDLDLDAIRYPSGRLHLDDQDEFAEHRVSLGYPHEVVEQAEATATALMALLGSGAAPFDRATMDHWLSVLAEAGHPPAD